MPKWVHGWKGGQLSMCGPCVGERSVLIGLAVLILGGIMYSIGLDTSAEEVGSAEASRESADLGSFEILSVSQNRKGLLGGGVRPVQGPGRDREKVPWAIAVRGERGLGLQVDFPAEWHSSKVINRLSAYYRLSTQEILEALEREYGRERLEEYQGADFPPLEDTQSARRHAAVDLADHILGSEYEQSDSFMMEVLGEDPSEYLYKKYAVLPGSIDYESRLADLRSKLDLYEGVYFNYCNELRAAIHMKVNAGELDMQPYMTVSELKSYQVQQGGKVMLFGLGVYTLGQWSLTFALFEGEAPDFERSERAWKRAQQEAKSSL